MGLFRRRDPAPQPSDRIAWITFMARQALAERGIETTVEHGQSFEDVTLRASGQERFPLYNVIAKTAGASAADATRVIGAHFDSLMSRVSASEIEKLTADQLRQRVRTRLLNASDVEHDQSTLRYAREFSSDLVLSLCLDFPDTVVILSDENVRGLALDVDELFVFGQHNTDREPVTERFQPAPGLNVVVGDSLFTASKAANLPALLGAARFGTLFTVPQRHLLIALPITGADASMALEQMIGATTNMLSAGPVPGGILSPNVHFSRGGHVDCVSSIDEGGRISLLMSEGLQKALDDSARRL